MSVYKELIYGMMEVEQKSRKIYPDASDFGVPVFDMNDPILKMVSGLKEMYEGKTETVKYQTGATQTVSIVGIDEWETKREFNVEFVWVTTRSDRKKNGMIGFLYVVYEDPRITKR